MDDKKIIFKVLNTNYELVYNQFFTNILVRDKISNELTIVDKFINKFILIFGEYSVDSNASSIDIYNEWFNENLNIINESKRERIDAIKTRFHFLVNFSNKRRHVR